jgi:hypothetical protein
VLGGGKALPLAIAAAAAFAIVAVGLLGALLGRSQPEAPSREPLAAVVPEPPPVLPPPMPEPAAPMAFPMPPPVEFPPPEPIVLERPEPMQPPMPRAGALEANVEPPGRYKVGDVVRQTVLVSRKTAYQVAGVDFTFSADYQFESSILIAKVNADGSMAAVQTIAAAKLLDADGNSKPSLADAVSKAPGMKFDLAIASDGTVTALEGLMDPLRVDRKDDELSRSLRLGTLLDADGWKELAGLTFFQPGTPLKPKATWNRPTRHDWGPLGDWSGKTVFASAGRSAGRGTLERIDFRHDLSHRAPKAGADRELPIRIVKAEFRTVAAGGAILFDPAMARTSSADELFHVRGSLIVTLDGLNAAVGLDERQAFRIVIDQPKEQALVGQPPRMP